MMMDIAPGTKCLFIKKSDASFILGDQAILEQQFRLLELHQHNCGGLRFFLIHLWTLIRLLYHLPGKSFVYIWFADYHAVLPVLLARLFGKPSFVVIGGYDAAKRPDLNYGGHLKPFRSWCIKKSCDWANYLLPVSQFVQTELNQLTHRNYNAKSTVIYNGVRLAQFDQAPEQRSQPKVEFVTICGGATTNRALIKGLDFYLEVAAALPEFRFRVIGLSGALLEWARKNAGSNVELISWVPYEQLPQILAESSVICQFSRYEAFGLALVEGMLCGNIPVGFQAGGTTELIAPRDPGLLIHQLEVQEASKVMKRAVALASKADQRIAWAKFAREHFSLANRKAKLFAFFAHRLGQ